MNVQAQDRIQTNVKYFFEKLTMDDAWQDAVDIGLLSCPLLEDWEQRQIHSHIVPIRTRPRHEQYLFFHMSLTGMNAYNVSYPTVAKGSSRIRMVFHAHNTEAEIDLAVASISSWAAEMMELEESGEMGRMPKAAVQVYAMQAQQAQQAC